MPFDLIVYFLLFFLGGYLLYGSLFAAVGSAVEQESDAQSLQLPIMIPVILPAIFLPFIADNPDAPLSVALSLVPFFSPILMVVRAAATDVPFWQMGLALAAPRARLHRDDLGGEPDLPRRDSDVRQKGDVPRPRAVGALRVRRWGRL